MNYVSTATFKEYYPEVDVSRFSDATLSGIITQASARVDSFVEYTFDVENVVDEKSDGYVNSIGDIVIFPRKRPINSVSAISIVKGTFDTAVSLTSGGENLYDIPTTKDRIVIPGDSLTLNAVSILDTQALRTNQFFTKISYNAGYTTIPSDVQQATMLYALDILSRRNNLSGATSVSQGGISITYSDNKGRSDFVKDAEELLAGYVRSSGF
jgi:hypothetical protein